jgi:amino acid transporter
MSFREKTAWITLITLTVTSLLFVLHPPLQLTLAPQPNPFSFLVLLLSIATFVVIEVVAIVVVAIRSPRDAKAPLDERERLIALKARSLAWYVLAASGLGSVMITIHLGANEIGLAYCVLASFVISLMVNYAARIVYYRRGA